MKGFLSEEQKKMWKNRYADSKHISMGGAAQNEGFGNIFQ